MCQAARQFRDLKNLKIKARSEFVSVNVWVGYTGGHKYVAHASDILLSAISQI